MRADLKWANYEAGLTKCIDAIVELLERGKESSAFEFRSDNAIKIECVSNFLLHGVGVALNKYDCNDHVASAVGFGWPFIILL
jgi:hypothetical protein